MSLLLGLALVGLGWSTLSRQRRVATRLVHQMEVISARRLAATAMSRDLRRGVAGRDWLAPMDDSLALRVFRGWGLVCPGGEARRGVTVVAYRGERTPNPAKDSVLVLTDGGWFPADLVHRSRTTQPLCPDGLDSDTELWALDPPISGVLMRVFERGSYHVAGGALRYRRGRGGRQPLTAEVFAGSSTLQGARGRILLRLDSDREPWGDNAWSVGISLWPREVSSPGAQQ